MEDLFKKFINAGVGLVSLTNDRVQSTIDKLVQDSKLSEQEGAKIMDELKKNTDSKRQELEKQFQGLASRLMKTAGIASNADVEELKRTVKGSSKSKAASASDDADATSPAAGKVSSTSVKATTTAAKTAAAVKAASTKSGNTTGGSKKSNAPESQETKANKTAAKKAISPNDNTSSSGSQLS